MTIILREIFKLLKILNSETGTQQIAIAMSLGFILGFSPFISLQGIFIILLIVFLRVQAAAAFVTAFFFSLIAYILDPVFHQLGSFILELKDLQGFWTYLYNLPLVPYTKFYNSVVMGAGAFGIIFAPIFYFISLVLIKNYRLTVVERFQKTKFWKGLQATQAYKWYIKYEEYFG
jgi:uncharacterized protein (TIGR03546 family)